MNRQVDDATRARARLHVLDWAGCAIGASRSAAARAMVSAFPSALQAAAADWQSEAMVFGSLGNVLEMDDVDKRALLHPGPVVIPAALVAAKMANAPEEAFLDAIVRGYEAVIRVGRAVGAAHYRFWHNTGTCGPFGAAAAAGSIFGLSTDQLSSAMGLAGTQASGLWQVRHEPGTHAKQLHTARAVHAGLSAAKLVDVDFVGMQTIFEGEQGFFAATCPGGDPADVIAEQDGWRIHDVSFKPWPACRHAHAAIDAALLARSDGVSAEQVEACVIETYADAQKFCDNPTPSDELSAKFSLQHAVAVTLIYGPPRLEHFADACFNGEAETALRRMMGIVVDEGLDAAYPNRFGTRVRLTLKSGEERVFETEDAYGDPENPVAIDGLIKKFRMLTESVRLDRASVVSLEAAATTMDASDPLNILVRRVVAEALA